MYIYLWLIIGVLLLGKIVNPKKNTLNKKIYTIIVFGTLALLLGLRGENVGVDTISYRNYYVWINKGMIDNFFEFGYYKLSQFLYGISKDPQILIFVTGIISIASVGVFVYRNSTDIVLSAYLFIALGLYDKYFNAIRQVLAVAFILIGIEFLKKNKRIIFSAFVFVATLFHSSAFIVLPIIFIYKKSIMKNKGILFILLSMLLTIFGRDLIISISTRFNIYENYIGSKFDYSNYFSAIIYYLQALCIFIVYFISKINFQKNNTKEVEHTEKQLCENIMCYMCMFSVLFQGMAIRYLIITRLTFLFSISYIYLIPIALSKMKNNKMLIKLMIMSISLAYLIIIMVFRPGWLALPYEFFWQ